MPILGFLGSALNFLGNAYANDINRENVRQTNLLNHRINTENINYSREAAEAADQRTRALYNDLYSPEARLQQLKNAGLSPGLMYGMSGAGGTSSTTGAQATTPSPIPMQNYQTQSLFNAEMMNILAMSAKTQAETENIKANTENQYKDLDVKEQTIKVAEAQEELTRKEVTVAEETIQKLLQEQLNIAQDTKNKEAQEELTKVQTQLTEINKLLLSNDLIYKDQMNYFAVKKLEQEWENLTATGKKLQIESEVWENYMDKMIKEMSAHALLMEAQKATTEADKKYIEELTHQLQNENNAEDWLNDLLDGPDNEEGQGKGIRKAIKTVAKAILEILKIMKGGNAKK